MSPQSHLSSTTDSRKSPQELSEEQQMFAEMMRVVEKRDALVALLEEKRISESTDARDLESIVHQFHWTWGDGPATAAHSSVC